MRLQVLDPSAKFTCGSCTKCCDQPWGTLIEADKAKALEAHDFGAYPQLAGRKFYRKSKGTPNGYFVLAKGEGTRCLFLDADGLCIIHKEMGAEAKPYPCLKFPYMAARTPQEDRISVDYGCPAVQNEAGPPLTEQENEIAAVIRPGGQRSTAERARVRIDPGCQLTPEEGDALLDRLVALFDPNGDPGPDVWERFTAAIALTAGVRRYKRKDDAAEGGGATGGEATGTPLATDAELVALLRRGETPPDTPSIDAAVAYEDAGAAPSPARLLFAATLYRDTLPPEATLHMGLLKRLTLLPKLMSLAKFDGVYASRLLGRNVVPGDVMRHPVGPTLDADSQRLLLRYFHSRLWQRYLVGGRLSVIAGLHQHIHDFNAVLFFARAEAMHEGSDVLTYAHVRRGLNCVEFHLANQPRLFDQKAVAWFEGQLENPTVAVASLRLFALRREEAGELSSQ